MSSFVLSNPSGALGNICSFFVKAVVVVSCAISVASADFSNNLLRAPAQSPTRAREGAPAVSGLPLPSNLPLIHRSHRRHFSPHGAPTLRAPAQPPLYGPLITVRHPPTGPHLSKPSMKSASMPPGANLPNIAPTHISPGEIPSGLAQPPLSPEVSRISFSALDASKINSSLVMHRVRFDPNIVGDFEVLNFTWFEAPAPSPAPVIVPEPIAAPAHKSSNATSPSPSNNGKHSDWILVFGISAGILVFAIVSVLIICSCTFHEGKAKPKASPTEPVKPRTADVVAQAGSLAHPSSTRFLQYEELKEATNNFAPASILGEGGFGRVFKGVLSDGTAVAIKRLTSGGPQGDKEFLVEVEMLSRLHHRNLVKLVGYYSSRDASQNLLCYELVPNGSLEAWLHGPLGVNCPLDWDTRMNIALDAARGLAYLHEDSQPCVIHRDFKASNILLENNFHAKVADFGLAKQAPEGRTNYLSTRVMGTFGYVAPEYAMTGHLLVKSDVYSYGVVLLELLTGRTPVDMSQPSGQENLVTWARPILRDKDRLQELADPRLGGKYPKEDFVRVCTIAAACVAPEASQRPTMGEVVQSLKMVQRVTEYQDSMLTNSNNRPNQRQSSTTFESDETSSMFSSGPFSGLSVFDNDNISRTAVPSEDLHEGR
ncbi:Kinase superfamily protein isoform 2 [Gossypium australe]|uniref:Kinase superfamily protein isoform 2 n=1 Tax=Gossypium australe TaxID=47621 RepID=A0A5B6UZ14_9ROSI|nr:Kinase superfamily protein isoform 2 [Gossypium australe]